MKHLGFYVRVHRNEGRGWWLEGEKAKNEWIGVEEDVNYNIEFETTLSNFENTLKA